ncbi:MAG TPA: hypothetical protein ENG98_03260 [Actinobacteria bacterium]|nr:hypothetical protein [Actinomycetota bacterium]
MHSSMPQGIEGAARTNASIAPINNDLRFATGIVRRHHHMAQEGTWRKKVDTAGGDCMQALEFASHRLIEIIGETP